MAAFVKKLFPRALVIDHLLLEDLNPNEVYVNNYMYDNNDIEVRYAQALDPWRWTRGWVHAMGMAIFLSGIIAIYVALYLQDLRIDAARLRVAIGNADKFTRNKPEYVHRAFTDRMSTHLRAFTYKRRHSWVWRRMLGGMSLGMSMTVLVGWLYPTLYTFTQYPYYHVYAKYGPPGLASRAGMIAVATIPFIIALGMKANWITLVTGVGHERLNVLHRWLGLLCLFFSVVHTIPFLVEPVRGDWGDDKGSWTALREKLLHGKGNIYYWNGFAALGCILWMNIASLPFFRRWRYEFFVHIHIFTGVGTLATLFWHCHDKLSSWHYLWATVVIWTTSLAWRFLFKTNWFSSSGKWFSGDTGTITRLTDDGIKITITTRMKWRPGQHVFLRIPAISYLDNHPFTVASKRFGKSDKVAEWNDMVLVFKPYKGFTRKVFDISRQLNDISYKMLLDGPYGGMPRKLESFDTVLLIAGGSGITPVIAHLQDLCRKIRKGKAVTTDVRIVWTVKRFESLEWFKDEISVAARSVPFGLVHCQYFVTEESPVEFCDYPISATQQWPTSPAVASMKYPFHDSPTGDDDGKPPMPALPGTAPEQTDGIFRIASPPPSASAPRPNIGPDGQRLSYGPGDFGDEVMIEFGRPRLREGIRPWAEGFGRRTCIYVCGPESMKIDVSNAVARLQHDIWRRENQDREEVYLHTETFGW
ncbi:ferric reductase like transmembrane component-domain-containing protein [Tirmania nivea]|nr:ferric reductase like transmembrane component-domain-containing protein [Tirmania nivea]